MWRGRRRQRGSRGVALLEVMIGSVMLGVGLAVVISLTSRSMARQIEGEMRQQAAWLADELLAMVIVEGPKDFSKAHDIEGKFDAPFQEFVYAVSIEDLRLGLLYRVKATVSWQGRVGIQTAEVQTEISQRQFYPDEDMETVEAREPFEPLDRESRWYDDEEDL